jgi:diaminohydroxyphosphoribosylaminopyrimidine deaminase/5-amino-6-(5-phosphoribosylamino)uracil reductase
MQVSEKTEEQTGMSVLQDQSLMKRALELAAKGAGQVSPGPLVGCVIASPEGEILGEGFYVYEQIKHAESYALEQAGPRAKGATAYVSLEPHAHHGRTPPCTTALIEAGIARVVAPIEDPNPLVAGRGFEHLRARGVEVSVGLLAREAEKLNEKYLHFMRTGRPFVHLKLAVSLDGKIATRTGDSRWIAGEQARARAHELRHECDAIMVGAGTVAVDDPLLTDRSGLPRRRQLTRIVMDERVQTTPSSQLARTARQAPVLLFGSASADEAAISALESQGVEVILDAVSCRITFSVLKELGQRSIQSVLLEGDFIDAGHVDKVTFFVAPLIIGGRAAPSAIGGLGAAKMAEALRLTDVEITHRGEDLEITGYLRSKDEG